MAEITSSELAAQGLSRRQRWALALAAITAFVGLGLGFILKDQTVSGTQPFRDLAAGILARYPTNWLLDVEGDYIFRVIDPASPGYRTTLQVNVIAIGEDAAARNILDSLTLERAQTLAAYRTLRSIPMTLRDGDPAIRYEYVYVEADANPFLEPIPAVVRGVDVVTIKRGQAIIVTFRVEADRLDQEIWRLEQFLASFEF